MRLIDESLWNAAIYAVEYLNDTSLLRKLIAEAEEPTIEAEPVRHGRWIHTDMAASWKPSCKDECGECHYHDKDHRDLSDFKFCPMCGSKMDGKEEK